MSEWHLKCECGYTHSPDNPVAPKCPECHDRLEVVCGAEPPGAQIVNAIDLRELEFKLDSIFTLLQHARVKFAGLNVPGTGEVKPDDLLSTAIKVLLELRQDLACVPDSVRNAQN